MYKIDVFDNQITESLRANESAQKGLHKPSGKLSASMLSEPLQWQVLKTLGAGTRVLDDYVLRKFARGNDTEEWYLNKIASNVISRQEFVSYRGAIGYIDAMVQTPMPSAPVIVLPMEVKSVSNAKFKNIIKRGEADEGHMLQAGFYGLAKGASHYAITYITADDYRTLTWVFSVAQVQPIIDAIIDGYQAQMAKQVVPVFTPRYAWQERLEYNKYPEWVGLNLNEIKLALDLYYPNAWENYEKACKKENKPKRAKASNK